MSRNRPGKRTDPIQRTIDERRTARRRWRISIASVLLVLAIGTVLVLGAGKNPSGPPERVILGDASSALAAPVWVAASKGYFRAEGLDVTLRHFELGKEAFAEMLQGKVDVATVAATPIVLTSFTGAWLSMSEI